MKKMLNGVKGKAKNMMRGRRERIGAVDIFRGSDISLLLFSTLIAVNGRKSLKINKVTLCIWIFGWRKLSLHHVRTQETPQIRCL